MALELRIIRGDTYDIYFEIVDSNGVPVSITSGGWIVIFESEYINKNSVDDAADFVIETGGYTSGNGVLTLRCTETDPPVKQRLHYKIKLSKDVNPPVIKTVSSGDLFFIDEAW
jgi:hypothetical protein